MKFGVSIDDLGNITINDRKLERYKEILESCKTALVTTIKLGSKYSSSSYYIYKDPDFIERFEKEIESGLEFLMLNNIYPEDLLDDRKTKKIVGDVIFRDSSCRIYEVVFKTNYTHNYVIPYSQILLEGIRNKGIRLWSLEKKPNKYGIFLGSSRKKKFSIKLINTLWNNNILGGKLRGYRKSETYIDTGYRVTLDTGLLSKYDPLRYMLETE